MSQQPPQSSHPTLINLPPPSSNPGTPSEIPGTPTSTTTSLSALSTTAIKDGHRGALHHLGHQHSPSANSLEAERADRISRLAGLSNVSMHRGLPAGAAQHAANSSQTTPTSTGFPANPTAAAAAGGLTPAYFNAAGQPVAATKVSTVGSASATESVGGRTTTTTTTEIGGDEDMLTEMDSASASGYMGADAMDEDLDNLASRSAGGAEDRMSDDGSASLVGFGEGAGSTVSGPIYQRRPVPWQGSSSAAGAGAPASWGLEQSSSEPGDSATASPNPPYSSSGGGGGGSGRRDFAVPRPLERDSGADTPVSQSAVRERREARMVDGVALDSAAPTAATDPAAAPDDDVFVDTTNRGPVPVPRAPTTSATRERLRRHQQPTQLRHAAQQPPQPPPSTTTTTTTTTTTASSSREAAERIIRERLDEGEGRVGAATLRSPRGGERLGRFYFEDR